ncbi:MAG: ATPase [Chloroflexi bacterium]|nr:ATPase [Chloroflexota bacterium]
MRYLLGVDGGNSKTDAAVADRTGAVLGIGRAGSGSHQAIGLAPAMVQIRCAAEGALHQAGVEPGTVDAAAYCLAGADLPQDFDLLRPALDGLALARRTALHNDTAAALRAGTDEPDAVAVVLGAGTNAAGCSAEGREIRLAGLGWLSGDWGGGDAIGQEAVRLSVRAWDGRGPETALQGMILEALGVPDVESLIARLYFDDAVRSGVRDLTPLVFEAAERGDSVARDLVRRVAEEAAVTATALLRRLDMLRRPADVVLAGGVFRARGRLLVDTVREELRARVPLARAVVPQVEPVLGALLCAMDMCQIQVNREMRERMAESFRRLERDSR